MSDRETCATCGRELEAHQFCGRAHCSRAPWSNLTDTDIARCIEALKARARCELIRAEEHGHMAHLKRVGCWPLGARQYEAARQSAIIAAASLASAIQRLRAMRRALAADDAVAREGAVCADRE